MTIREIERYEREFIAEYLYTDEYGEVPFGFKTFVKKTNEGEPCFDIIESILKSPKARQYFLSLIHI